MLCGIAVFFQERDQIYSQYFKFPLEASVNQVKNIY